ncbi:RNA recognition motif domain-containing protein [Methylomagnum sp.]
MGSKLYVGNLGAAIDDPELERLFADYGTVHAAHVVRDLGTGQSRGFGFVELDNEEEAEAARSALRDKEVDGRRLVINAAHSPRNGTVKNRGYLGKRRTGARPQREV